MKRNFILSFSFLLALFFALPIQALQDMEEFNVNGVKVLLKPAANQVVVASLFILGGSTNITAENAGIENLMLQVATTGGTKNFAKDKFNSELSKMGTTISASSELDYSVVRLRCVRENFDRSWEIFADALLHPLFDTTEVKLTKDKVISSLKLENTNPDALVRKTAQELFFKGHPYANRPTGNPEIVGKFTAKDLNDYHKKVMETSRLLLVVVGNMNKNDLAKKVEETLGTLSQGDYRMTKLPPFAKASASDLSIVEKKLPTNYIIGFYAAPSLGNPDYYASAVGHSILSQRLFEEVRTKRNLSYAVAAGVSLQWVSYGNLYVTTTNPDSSIKVMFAVVEKMQKESLPEKDLNNSVSQFITRDYLQKETNQAQSNLLAAYQLYTGSWKNALEFVRQVKEVKSEDVQRVMAKYIQQINFAVIGDKSKINPTLFTSK